MTWILFAVAIYVVLMFGGLWINHRLARRSRPITIQMTLDGHVISEQVIAAAKRTRRRGGTR